MCKDESGFIIIRCDNSGTMSFAAHINQLQCCGQVYLSWISEINESANSSFNKPQTNLKEIKAEKPLPLSLQKSHLSTLTSALTSHCFIIFKHSLNTLIMILFISYEFNVLHHLITIMINCLWHTSEYEVFKFTRHASQCAHQVFDKMHKYFCKTNSSNHCTNCRLIIVPLLWLANTDRGTIWTHSSHSEWTEQQGFKGVVTCHRWIQNHYMY